MSILMATFFEIVEDFRQSILASLNQWRIYFASQARAFARSARANLTSGLRTIISVARESYLGIGSLLTQFPIWLAREIVEGIRFSIDLMHTLATGFIPFVRSLGHGLVTMIQEFPVSCAQFVRGTYQAIREVAIGAYEMLHALFLGLASLMRALPTLLNALFRQTLAVLQSAFNVTKRLLRNSLRLTRILANNTAHLLRNLPDYLMRAARYLWVTTRSLLELTWDLLCTTARSIIPATRELIRSSFSMLSTGVGMILGIGIILVELTIDTCFFLIRNSLGALFPRIPFLSPIRSGSALDMDVPNIQTRQSTLPSNRNKALTPAYQHKKQSNRQKKSATSNKKPHQAQSKATAARKKR
jgi:hypothetical protein